MLSLLYRSAEEDQPLVRDAITCTRELVSTLSLTPVSLPVALARWRAELRERLEPAGVALEWVLDGDPAAVILTARQYANLTRILRESVTNALKHAGAGRLRLAWKMADAWLAFSVQDDGVGLHSPEHDSGGRGMAIMRARAEELGGTVEWGLPPTTGQPGGCEVRVRMPLEARVARWREAPDADGAVASDAVSSGVVALPGEARG